VITTKELNRDDATLASVWFHSETVCPPNT